MSNIQIFNNPEFGSIRTIEQNGEPWFVGKDVAAALGYSNTKDALAKHVDEQDKLQGDGVAFRDPLGREQHPTIINESGLYSLIFSSKLEGAQRFKRWVISEVLPSIRKHGAYMTPETLQAAILNPDTMIQLCQQLKAEQDKNAALTAANSQLTVDKQIMQPKADYFDELVDRNLLTSFRETAKQLEIKEKVLIQFLMDKKYIYRDKKGKLMPYAEKNNGLFEVKECFNEKTQWSGTQTLVTPKGRETFRLMIPKTLDSDAVKPKKRKVRKEDNNND